MVFLVAVPLTLWLAGQGLGALLGGLGTFVQGMNVDPNQARSAADQARQTAQQVTPADVAGAAERARNASWGALLGTVLGLAAATLGGYLGADDPSKRVVVEREVTVGH
jgi:hypothetical protein